MTAEERADFHRKELLRQARFEAFVLRTEAAARVGEEVHHRLLKERVREKQGELEFVI